MAELVTVSGRGHSNYQSSFGPKERRKRQGKCHFFSYVHTFISAGLRNHSFKMKRTPLLATLSNRSLHIT
jgi:hypothetical protein